MDIPQAPVSGAVFLGFSGNKHNVSGVYFLCDDQNKVVYVGLASSVISRVGTHTDKQFSHAFYIPYSRDMLHEKEVWWIRKLNPPLNKAHKQSKYVYRMKKTKFIFTKTRLFDLMTNPLNKRIWVYDMDVSGLCFLVGRSGCGSFYYLKKIKQEYIRFRIAGITDISLAFARYAARHFNRCVVMGMDIKKEWRNIRSTKKKDGFGVMVNDDNSV